MWHAVEFSRIERAQLRSLNRRQGNPANLVFPIPSVKPPRRRFAGFAGPPSYPGWAQTAPIGSCSRGAVLRVSPWPSSVLRRALPFRQRGITYGVPGATSNPAAPGRVRAVFEGVSGPATAALWVAAQRMSRARSAGVVRAKCGCRADVVRARYWQRPCGPHVPTSRPHGTSARPCGPLVPILGRYRAPRARRGAASCRARARRAAKARRGAATSGTAGAASAPTPQCAPARRSSCPVAPQPSPRRSRPRP
jgi:hypothetical protein